MSEDALSRTCARWRTRTGPSSAPLVAADSRDVFRAVREPRRARPGRRRDAGVGRRCGQRCGDAGMNQADGACIREAASARVALPPRSPWTTRGRPRRRRTHAGFPPRASVSAHAIRAQMRGAAGRGAQAGGRRDLGTGRAQRTARSSSAADHTAARSRRGSPASCRRPVARRSCGCLSRRRQARHLELSRRAARARHRSGMRGRLPRCWPASRSDRAGAHSRRR
jgi:hypothetical protein